MPFNLAQIFGGWRRKEVKKAPRVADEISSLPAGKARRGRAPERAAASSASDARDKEISDAARGTQTKNKSELAWKLIKAPHISEKSAMSEGRYVFRVAGGATKPRLKNAVQDRYGVNVLSVNIIAPRDKKRRRGANFGIKSGFKKAIIKLKAGEVISEF